MKQRGMEEVRWLNGKEEKAQERAYVLKYISRI